MLCMKIGAVVVKIIVPERKYRPVGLWCAKVLQEGSPQLPLGFGVWCTLEKVGITHWLNMFIRE